MPKRTPEEIRASIEQNREALGESIGKLRDEFTELTDWRSQLRQNQEQLTIAAAGTGFVIGGGIGGSFSLVFGHGRRKRAKADAHKPNAADKIAKKAAKAATS
jgi:hypothetical protein